MELECGGLTSAGPALAVFNDRLYRAWKGMSGDNRMFSSRFDGAHWSQEHSGMGLTSDGPSLAAMRNALFAAWKGVPGDNRMFFASYPGSPSIELRAIADPGDLLEVIGTGFTHDGAVRVVAILEDTLGAKPTPTNKPIAARMARSNSEFL
jgi:hypothetical protein